MQVNIQEILIKAIEQFQLFSDSIEKREEAYIKFFYQFLTKYFQDKGYSNLLVLAESAIQIGERNIRPDLVISERNSGKMLAVIEGLRVFHLNKSLILSHYESIGERFLTDANTPLYIIAFIENPKTTWQQYLDIFSKKHIPIRDISEKDVKGIKMATSATILNQNIYHIGVWLADNSHEQKSQNKITTIKLYNFKLFENLEIPLSPSINIFLGKNGFGKTSILQAVAMANLPEQSIEIKYKKFIKQGQEAAEIYLQREHEREMRITLDTEKKIHETAFVQEPLFLAYGPNIFSKDTRLDYDEMIDALLKGTNEWYYVNSLFNDFDDKLYSPLGILQKLSEQKTQEATQIKDIIITKLNDLIPDYRIATRKNGSDYYFVDINHNYLDLTQVSEGYRTNILLLTSIITKIISLRASFNIDSHVEKVFEQAKGVIAIDEFDRHLHPSWQRKFVTDLNTHFPKIQFILTTHNPVSVLNRNINEIQEITFTNGDFQLKQVKEATSFMDIELILLKYFGLNSVVGDLLQHKIDTYYEKRLRNEDVHVLEKELQDLLVGIPVTDIRYLKFLDILQKKGHNISNLQEMRETDFASIAEEAEWNEYLQSLYQ